MIPALGPPFMLVKTHHSPPLGSHHRRARRGRLAAARAARAADLSSDVVRDGFRARPLAWLRCVWTRLDRSRSLGLAAEMAFWLFLSLLPLAAVAGLVTAKLASGSWSTTAPLLESLPLATRELVGTELGRVAA